VKANKPQPTDDRQGNLHDLERHANATGADLSRFRRPDRRKAVRSKGPRQEPTRGAPLRGTDPPSCPHDSPCALRHRGRGVSPSSDTAGLKSYKSRS
jgi:hypothetical protein